MTIFALDSSTASASVAIVRDSITLFTETTDFGTTHSEKLCDKAFKAVGIKPSDIDLFAVCNGPGSYTGLRIGVSVIKGLAYAVNKPTQPVSTLKTLASSHQNGNVVALLNARRGNYFCAAYKIIDSQLTEIVAPMLAHGDEIYHFFGNEDFILTGDGAQLFYDNTDTDVKNRLNVSNHSMPRADIAAMLAVSEYENTGGCTAEQLLPNYIRDVRFG